MEIKYSNVVSFEPVSANDVRVQARIDDDVWEEVAIEVEPYLNDTIIPAARRNAEHYLRMPLVAREVTYHLDCDPCNPLKIPTTSIKSIVSFTYFDSAGDTQSFDITGLLLDGDNYPARIHLKAGISWPETFENTFPKLKTITGIAETIDDVEQSIKHAILLFAAGMYENRETSIVGKEDKPIYMSAIKILKNHSIPVGYPS